MELEILDTSGMERDPIFFPNFQSAVRRGIILELISEFERSQSEKWNSSEIVDFLLSKLEENK